MVFFSLEVTFTFQDDDSVVAVGLPDMTYRANSTELFEPIEEKEDTEMLFVAKLIAAAMNRQQILTSL